MATAVTMGTVAIPEKKRYQYNPRLATGCVAAGGTLGVLILAVVLIIYLFLGCLMPAIPMLILTVPIFFPVIMAMQYDPIWFGVIMVLMFEMA